MSEQADRPPGGGVDPDELFRRAMIDPGESTADPDPDRLLDRAMQDPVIESAPESPEPPSPASPQSGAIKTPAGAYGTYPEDEKPTTDIPVIPPAAEERGESSSLHPDEKETAEIPIVRPDSGLPDSGPEVSPPSAPRVPKPEFEVNENAYWHPEDGTPTKPELTTLKRAVKDVGRGFGGQVSQIAKNNRFDPDHPNTRAPIHEDGYQFARLALDYKNADEARRKEILDEELGGTGLEESSYEQAYKEARRRLKRDLDAASKLEPQEISNLGQAITDYRFLEKNLKDAGVAYKKRNAWGRLRGGKETLTSPGTAVTAALIRLRTRKSVADPEKTGKLRRGLMVGSVAVVGAFLGYRGAVGIAELAQAGGGMDFVEGATDLTYWPPITEGDSGEGSKVLSLDLDGDSGDGAPEKGSDKEQAPGDKPPEDDFDKFKKAPPGETPGGQQDGGSEDGQPPAAEQPITDEQRKIDRDMASMEKFEDLGVNHKDYYDFLDEKIEVGGEQITIGEQLQKDGVLYWEPDARNGQGEWRLNYNGGELADDKIRWIREQAEAKGYLGGTEAGGEKPPEAPAPEDEYVETGELGKFDEALDQKTGYLNGTGINATSLGLNELAQDLGYNELDFKKLQQTPGFNEAYYNFMNDEVLPYNNLDWDGARKLASDYRLKIPEEPAKEFLDKYAAPKEAEISAAPPEGTQRPETATILTSAENATLPDYYEIKSGDDYQSIFQRIAENDRNTPEELKNPDAQNEFLQNLLADRDKISQLYKGVEGDAMSASWNSYLAESIFVPQVERGGRWYIDPAFIANATDLMRRFANPEGPPDESAGEYALAA